MVRRAGYLWQGTGFGLLLSSLLLLGCAAEEQEVVANSSANGATSSQASGAVSSAVNLERGELLSYACQACHSLEPGGTNPIGPNLYGIFGRMAGEMAGFSYSAAVVNSGILWSPETLDQWLAEPNGFLPGNNMPFAGYANPNDRRDLLAYLVIATGGTQ